MTKTSIAHKHRYLAEILVYLHLEFDNFILAILNGDPYETLVYQWVDKLYEKGKSINEALPVMYKARNFYLLHKAI